MAGLSKEKKTINKTNSARLPASPSQQQQQPFPGLAGKMQPCPDHGEDSYQGSGRLSGRKALITGGDSGIGRTVAIAYARGGADVAINCLPKEEDNAREAADLIKKAGRNVLAIPGDIHDEAFCGHLVKQAIEGLGGLDIPVNNAGRQQFCELIEEFTTEDFDATFKTNAYAMFWITKVTIPHLPSDGVIINTSSVQAYEPSEILLDYAQTKAAIMAFTKSLAKQLVPKGVRVNVVASGPYWTVLQCCDGQPQERVEKFGTNTPLGHPGQPVEVAPLYVILTAGENSYTSGQVWCPDGGTGTL